MERTPTRRMSDPQRRSWVVPSSGEGVCLEGGMMDYPKASRNMTYVMTPVTET